MPLWSCMNLSSSKQSGVITGCCSPLLWWKCLRVPQHCQLSGRHLPAACLRVCGMPTCVRACASSAVKYKERHRPEGWPRRFMQMLLTAVPRLVGRQQPLHMQPVSQQLKLEPTLQIPPRQSPKMATQPAQLRSSKSRSSRMGCPLRQLI